MHDIAELKNIMPFMIPIVGIVMGVGIGMLALWIDYRKKRDIFELHHKERLLAIERGMEVPPLPDAIFGNGAREARTLGTADYLRRGLIWLLVGLGIGIAMALNSSIESATWALIPVGFGLANLIFYGIESRRVASTPAPR